MCVWTAYEKGACVSYTMQKSVCVKCAVIHTHKHRDITRGQSMAMGAVDTGTEVIELMNDALLNQDDA